MGQKGVRAMTPLDSTLANNLRVKLGKGRELPEEPKPKRPPRPKVVATDGSDVTTKGAPRPRTRDPKGAPPPAQEGDGGRRRSGPGRVEARGDDRQAAACPHRPGGST